MFQRCMKRFVGIAMWLVVCGSVGGGAARADAPPAVVLARGGSALMPVVVPEHASPEVERAAHVLADMARPDVVG